MLSSDTNLLTILSFSRWCFEIFIRSVLRNFLFAPKRKAVSDGRMPQNKQREGNASSDASRYICGSRTRTVESFPEEKQKLNLFADQTYFDVFNQLSYELHVWRSSIFSREQFLRCDTYK